MKNKKITADTGMLAIACWMAYTSCYAGRSILSAVMPQMIAGTEYTKTDLGAMGSAFFLTYGIGQLVNGLIGDRVKAKYMISSGLFFAGVVLILFPLLSSVQAGVVLWGLCGFLLSMLWGPLSKVVAENTSERMGRILLTGLAVAALLGMVAASLIAVFASFIGQWKSSFFIAGTILMLAAVVWFVLLHMLERRNAIKSAQGEFKRGVDRQLSKILLNNAIVPMLAAAMINGIIRNAVAFWIPTYMNERLGFDPALSAGVSAILPIINLVGTFVGLYLLRKLKENEFSTITLMFGASMVMFALVIVSDTRSVVLTVGLLFTACAAMASASNMIFSVYCLKFRDTGRMSAVTGLMNFGCYAASAAASAIFIAVVTEFGWNPTVLLWAALSLLGTVFTLLAQKVFRKRSKDRLQQPACESCVNAP